ncbi:amidase domain-containing protein [Brevibacillus ginsengisoli]|uniref:amidase domain-containing protein n=1 Tax=Brevibacillus ginsengisoli TaxID=363854 RepID=UPI003CF58147
MGLSWKEYVKEYVEKLNQTYLDGKLERLVGFFSADETITREIQRWSREIERSQQNGIQLIASKIQVVPLTYGNQPEQVFAADLLIHQKLYYKQGDQTYLKENRLVQPVELKPDKYGWAFIRPWGWFLDQIGKDNGTAQADTARVETTQVDTNQDTDQTDSTQLETAPGDSTPADTAPIETVSGHPGSLGSNHIMVNHSQTKENQNEANVNHSNKQPATDEKAREAARIAPYYNRVKAVEYANAHWNHPNPAFHTFEVDCTNFVSQCLYAGGIPMIYTNNQGSGWWYTGNSWSWSWSVANALYLLLKSGKAPFYARQMEAPNELQIGDVICYDFDGNGHWQHNTFVVAHDENGMPLVNARTYDSTHRYWEYTDSTAYTPNIQYAFFHIYGKIT